MKIVTFNMDTGGPAQWRALLDEMVPDLALVQESRDPRESLGADLFNEAFSGTVLWRAAEHGRWGTALATRAPILEEIPLPGWEGWVTGALVELPSDVGAAQVFSVHIPSGRGAYLALVHRLLDEVDSLGNRVPVVIGGDFNLTVGERAPEESLKNRKGEMELIRRIETDFGLINPWAALHPGQPLPQTLRWKSNREPPYHCDGIFVPDEMRRPTPGDGVTLKGRPKS